jgi:hypothetical protein
MQMSASAYYNWLKHPQKLEQVVAKKQLELKTQAIFKQFNYTYGSRRLSRQFQQAGFKVGHYQTRSLM